MGLDSLYCGKWRKISKSRPGLDLERTMPNVELFQAILYTTIPYVQVSSGLNHYFSSYRVHRQTDTHTHTHRHTDRHEYSIISAVGKP